MGVAKKQGRLGIKRVIMVFSVMVIMAAMFAAFTMPAFAVNNGNGNDTAAKLCHEVGKLYSFPSGQCTSYFAKYDHR